MNPRFDRRRDQGQGQGRPGRGAARGGSRPFAPRGEWRPEGGERPGRGDRPQRGERPGRPERRFDAPRPDGLRRDGLRRDGGRDGGREAGRGEGLRQDGPRFGGGRPEGSRFGGSRPERRFDRRPGRPGARPQGRPPFPGRPPLDARRQERSAPVAVEVPSGESERFGAEPADDLIWGRHAAQAALEGDRPIHRIWCTPEMRFQPRFLQLLREAKAGGVLVEEVTWARLGQLTGGAVHQGIVLQAAAADTLDLGSLVEGCRDLGEPPLLMALDGVTDPHNLGAIVRSAEALGAHGLVLPQRRSAGLTGSVAKVAAGALEHLPVARVVNLNRALDQLKQEGYRVIGLAGEGSLSLGEADLEGPLVIVTGSEGSGLSMLTRKHCDQLVRIPLRGATPSLNASVATAMVLYEVARRGWMKQISGTAPAPRIVRPSLPAPPAIEAPSEQAPSPMAEPPLPEQHVLEQHVLEQPIPEQTIPEQPSAPAAEPAPQPDPQPAVVLDLDAPVTPSFSGDIQL